MTGYAGCREQLWGWRGRRWLPRGPIALPPKRPAHAARAPQADLVAPSTTSADAIFYQDRITASATPAAPPPAARTGHAVVARAAIPPGAPPAPLAKLLPSLLPSSFPTITAARKACRRGEVLVNGAPGRIDTPVAGGDVVEACARVGGAPRPAPSTVAASFPVSSIQVVYEDDHLAVVVKPPGVATQGTGSLGDLRARLPAALAPSPLVGALWRPVPCHRLDAWAGGLVVVAKTRHALQAVSAAFGAREVATRCAALVVGRLAGAGRVAAPLDGRPALTQWRALRSALSAEHGGWVTAVEVQAVTGTGRVLGFEGCD